MFLMSEVPRRRARACVLCRFSSVLLAPRLGLDVFLDVGVAWAAYLTRIGKDGLVPTLGGGFGDGVPTVPSSRTRF